MKEILSEKIDDGFAFPLNPKWILCDEGWKDLYDKLLASEAPNVQGAMNVWYPADVRERIAAISSKHPIRSEDNNTSEGLGLMRMKRRRALVDHELLTADIAELELERYKHARTGLGKLRAALVMAKKPNTKARNFSFFSSVLLMNHIGKEADAQKKRTEVETGENRHRDSKKLRSILRRRSTIDSQTTTPSIASVDSESSESSEDYGTVMKNGRPLRRKSITNYIRNRLSSKMLRRNSA